MYPRAGWKPDEFDKLKMTGKGILRLRVEANSCVKIHFGWPAIRPARAVRTVAMEALFLSGSLGLCSGLLQFFHKKAKMGVNAPVILTNEINHLFSFESVQSPLKCVSSSLFSFEIRLMILVFFIPSNSFYLSQTHSLTITGYPFIFLLHLIF